MTTMTAARPEPVRTLISQPLFVTRDRRLLTTLTALAARAGTPFLTAPDGPTANRHWLSASTVVVGADAVREIANARLPERSDLILVSNPELPQEEAWPLALSIGARHAVTLPDASDWLVRRIDPDPPPAPMPPVIAVTGALGGVGASTVAAAVGVLAGRNGPASLVDADTSGPGIDLLLGWERDEGRRWPSIVERRREIDPSRWRDRLPVRDGLAVVAADVANPVRPDALTLRAIVETCRGTGHLTVVDVPRHSDRVVATVTPDLLVVVVPADVRAIAAARAILRRQRPGEARVIVRRTSGPSARAVAAMLDAPLLAEIGDDPAIPLIMDSGRFTAGFGGTVVETAARAVLDAIGARP